MESLGLRPNRIEKLVLTHFHPDHIGGAPEIVGFCSPLVMIHEAEADYVEDRMGIEVQVRLKDGDTIAICLYNAERKVLFSGDTVFAYGIGRTDIPGGNTRELKKSIKRLTELDVEILLPGHDVPVLGHANENIQIDYSLIESIPDDY